MPIARATAGNIVLVEGIDATITKTATVVSDFLDTEMHIFRCVAILFRCVAILFMCVAILFVCVAILFVCVCL